MYSVFFRNESLGPGRIQVGGSHEHQATGDPSVHLRSCWQQCSNKGCDLHAVGHCHSHSHNILAVSSSPALLPLAWFIVIFHLDKSQVSQLVFLPLSFFSYPCHVSGLADEARMGGGGGGGEQ